VTDPAQHPDATPDGTTPEGIPVDDGDEHTETARATSARDADAVGDTASAEDGVPADDAGAQASVAAAAAAHAANAGGTGANAPATGDSAAETDDDEASEVIDLDVLADSDPRSKAELLGELVVAEHKRDEYLDDLRRSHADFENYRRRILREGAAQREAGKADIAGPLLEVLDDLDRTLVAADGSPDKDLAKGVALVASKLTTTLGRVGLERIEATEVPFDPNVHEAVQEQPADEPTDEPVVVQVLRPGYRLGERTLRPAMVVVEQ
jgi:molecular chaperone GrpE